MIAKRMESMFGKSVFAIFRADPNARITVNVVTKDPIAPIEESKISIDGQTPDTAGTPTWNASQKYFERTFSKTLTIGEFSRYIKVVATNAVGNVGSGVKALPGLACDFSLSGIEVEASEVEEHVVLEALPVAVAA